ncbi:MAG: inositol monophosphatase [Candidatus Magasanikbacteria bacterium]|jgi:myo-inositol-1(or 4)-monophosphatase|nr:inositol monophosphatase [Candidatus Magasanikbacteria bacterium]
MEDFLKRIIKEAGILSKEYFDKGVTFQTKTHLGDLLTEADLAVNDFLLEEIKKEYPDHKITSEERDQVGADDAQYEWVIDPIDGTRNFAKGISMWCNIIAVLKDGEPYLAAVYNPVGNELFFAKKDHGATLNGMPISVCDKQDFDFGAGSISCMREETELYGRYTERFTKFWKRFLDETNTWHQHLGNMLGLCFTASGGFDFFIQNAGLDHDFIAPVLIAREAGAIATDSDGNEWKRGRQDIIVANPVLHPKIMAFFPKN